MSSDDADAAKLRAELAQAQAGLATAGHNQASFLRILECAELSVDDRLQVTFSRNGEQIFESCNTPCAVLDLFTESAEARRYFEWIFDQREVMRAQAKAAESMPWDQIFPSPRRREDSLLRFHPLPAQDWEVTADSALTRGPTNPLGAYLMSHRQLLAADQDFRIEYEATAGPEPGDLSLVVGGAADDGIFNQQAPLPEDRGYCFAFGGNANTVSELQRFRRSMAASATVLEPGRTYRCAAERVGGRLRFYVDGAVLYEYIDILPLLGDGHGYVGLYTWGAGQRFANLRVASRPTCLSQEQRRQIAAYRAPVLEARSATPRYVEVRLVGTRTGQPRTTYQLLARDSTAAILESHRRRDAERASNFEAERLAVTLRSIGDGIITTDIHGLVTLMNHSAEVLTGWTQAEALGKPLTKVFHIIRATRLGGPDERGVGVLLDGKAAVILGDDATLTMVARDGTRRFIQRTAASIQDATGRALGTVLIFRDVTAQHRADEARAQLAAIVESSEDAIIGKSLDGRIVSWNAGAERMLGYTAAEVIGRSGEFLLAQGAPHETTEMTQRVATAQTAEHYETVYLTRDLKPIHVALTKSVIRDAAGLLSGVSTIARDIGERIRTEAALRESEERYALAARGANDGLWDWNLKSGQVYFSARFKAMLGLGENELASTMEAWYALIDPADVDALRNAIAAHAARRTSQLEVEHRMFHADGSVRWMLTRAMGVFDESGQATRIAGSLTDVTDRKAAEEQFRHDALHDQLTGLPNRALFADRLGHALQRLRRNKDYCFAVMFLDLDRFKKVNDSLGHLYGDRLLIEISHRLAAILRPVDTVGRLGGDEFTVLLDGIHALDNATEVAGRILRDLQLPFHLAGREIFISVSIGIVMSSTHYGQAQEVLRDADIAMYRAKALGKSRYQVFDNSMHERAVERLLLETDLRKALERGELTLHFDPVYELAGRRLAGAEAQIAWPHPKRGLLLGRDLRALAEETGLIGPIWGWALRESLRRWHDWRAHQPAAARMRLGLELSVFQFMQPTLIEDLRAMFKDAQIDPATLRLEVPEAAVVENLAQGEARLAGLRALGVELCLSQFGAGHASLSSLHRLPLQMLKIDARLLAPTPEPKPDASGAQPAAPPVAPVAPVATGAAGAAVVAAGHAPSHGAQPQEFLRLIASMAQRLQLELLAEGVQTQADFDLLGPLACRLACGPLFSEPLSAERFAALLARDAQLPTPVAAR